MNSLSHAIEELKQTMQEIVKDINKHLDHLSSDISTQDIKAIKEVLLNEVKAISIKELLNLGNSLREYLKLFKEPLTQNDSAKIYEWENDKGVRFRLVTDTVRNRINHHNINEKEGDNCHSVTTFPADIIITFYSDRNADKRMEFKNQEVAMYYENKERKSKAAQKEVKRVSYSINTLNRNPDNRGRL